MTGRRLLPKSAAEIQTAHRGSMNAGLDGELPPDRAFFGQRHAGHDSRSTGCAGQHKAAHDLFSQAFVPSPFVSPPASDAAERSILTRARTIRLRNAALVVGGFLIGLLAVPALLLSTPQSPIAAPLAGSSNSGLQLRDIAADIAPHGDGAVLSVAGTVANHTAAPARLPPMRIVLTAPGGELLAKPLRAGVEWLAPGQSVRFVSALAVRAGTVGDVSVGFDDAARPRR